MPIEWSLVRLKGFLAEARCAAAATKEKDENEEEALHGGLHVLGDGGVRDGGVTTYSPLCLPCCNNCPESTTHCIFTLNASRAHIDYCITA